MQQEQEELFKLVSSWTSNSEDVKEWISEFKSLKIRSLAQLMRFTSYEDLWNALCERVSLALSLELRDWRKTLPQKVTIFYLMFID